MKHSLIVLTATSIALALFPGSAGADIVSTAFGNGADAEVGERPGEDRGNGTGVNFNARWVGDGVGDNGDRNEMIALRFDLSSYTLADLQNATLSLTSFRGQNQGAIRLYGVTLGATPTSGSYTATDWVEAGILCSTMPGLIYDGDSRTQGLNLSELTDLGALGAATLAEGDVITFSDPSITTFLNGYAASSVSFLIAADAEFTGQVRLASKEAAGLTSITGSAGDFAPYLSFTLVPEPAVGTLALLGLGVLGTWRRRQAGRDQATA